MSPAGKKRVLLVSHNFPPTGSGGVHRPVKFARYLRDFGWEVEVLTVRDIRYHAYDPSLLDEIPNVPVHRAGSLEPLRLNWLLGWRPPPLPSPPESFADLERRAAGNAARPASAAGRLYKTLADHLFLPDTQIGWVPFALARAMRLLRRRRFDVVLTTSPPESCHLVGLALKLMTGCRWVADFRDAWSRHHLRRGLFAYHRWVNELLEKWVLRRADGVIANTEGMAPAMESLAGRPLSLLVLRNGFDPADFDEPLPAARADDYVMVHNGSFRGGRRARTILEGFAGARVRSPEFAARARLYLLGINRSDDLALAEELGLADVVFPAGYVRHADAMRACLGADLLVLAMSREEGASLVPGKLYEYLGAGRPILAAIPPGEAANIISGTTAGATVVAPDTPAAVADGFLACFSAAAGDEKQYETKAGVTDTYNRRTQVAVLAEFLKSVLK
jgi:hypothetical protein